jgi:hypothetical protein
MKATAISEEVYGMAFWLTILVLALFLVAICTAAYNDDKTKGL